MSEDEGNTRSVVDPLARVTGEEDVSGNTEDSWGCGPCVFDSDNSDHTCGGPVTGPWWSIGSAF